MTQLQDKYRIAVLSAFAVGLHGMENLLPSPVPWLRVGLANIITLITLYIYGFRAAFMVTLVRTFVSSLLTGTFMGPAFIMSLSGGIAGTLSMWAVIAYMPRLFSAVGVSIAGAFFHNSVQLFLAYFLFIQRIEAIILISPVIILAGTLTGTVNGVIAQLVVSNLQKQDNPA